MSIDVGKVRITVGFFAAAFIACAVNYGDPGILALGCFSVALHEITHLLFLLRYHCRYTKAEILPGGIRISTPDFDSLSYRRAAVCLLSAPVCNILLAVCFRLLGRRFHTELFFRAAAVNLSLGAVNLLPLSFLDGGRALELLLRRRVSFRLADRILRISDISCLFLIGSAVVILCFYGSFSLPLAAFFFYCLLAAVRGQKNKC